MPLNKGFHVCSSILLAAALSPFCGGDESVKPSEKRLVDVEDYFTQAHVADCEVSPDGTQIVYVDSRWQLPDESRNSDLWVVGTQGANARRLTFDDASDANPTWSEDGTQIFFTSRRKGHSEKAPLNGKTQVWRLNVASGHTQAITRLKDGVTAYQLSTVSNTLYYTVDNESGTDVWSDLRDKFDDLSYGQGKRTTSQLWKLELDSWRATKIVDEEFYIREFSVNSDQTKISLVVANDDQLITHEGQSRVEIYEVNSGELSKLDDSLWRDESPSRHGWIEQPTWSTDNERLAFRVVYDGYPAEIYCADTNPDADTASIWRVDRPSDVTVYGGQMQWHDDRLLYIGEHRARQHVYEAAEINASGASVTKQRTHGDVVVSEFSVDPNSGRLCVVKADPTSGLDLFLSSADAQPKRLTMINPQMRDWKMPQMSIVSWKSSDGTTVEGILELPPDHTPADGPLPLIVQIHGGPTSATRYAFQFWPYGRTLMPSKGFALFSPNYRGSTGYGDKFMTDLIGRENAIDVDDILTGVDSLVKRGVADPKRMGVMGWSNGGFLTNAIITQTDRFKAASSGAGVIDQTMQWALEDTPGHVINYQSGTLPWEDTKAYIESSPLFGLGNVTTPTLIHVGANDARVPAAHARTLFRALSRYGTAPTELIVYPDTGHSPLTYSHRKAKMEWDLAWFEKYVLGKEPE